ncbi:LysR family transcriptional regulator [Specibacter cremeus]|uniref:LysR family transcriptional regulator n=1 Tax=Specibacter cremeus TaxID=1629051 RepID=UPI000F7B1E17|nr:LysR family transcriptional regulator [Specibacter cremeus]
MSERWPDLAVLELLVVIAEHGSVSAGAQTVGMAQPNASRAILQFERAHGIRLIDRSPRGSTLTAEGAALVEGARGALDAARSFSATVDALQQERTSQLRVEASMTIAEYLAPVWLARLRKRLPSLQVSFQVRNSVEVLALLKAGECDVGFIESPSVPRRVRSAVVATDRLAVVVNPTHPWARRSAITAKELASTPLVVREYGSGTRTTLDDALSGFTVPAPVLELNSTAAVRGSVISGAGPAVLSELAVGSWVGAGELVQVPVADMPLERRLRAVWVGPHPLKGPAAELVTIAREESRTRRARSRG